MRTYEELSIWLPPHAPLLGRSSLVDVGFGNFAWREDGDAYYLESALRGFRKRDVHVELRDGRVEIRAERQRGLWRNEHRSFRQQIALPQGADATRIDARFEDGTLSIRISKRARARRRVVPIRVNGALPASLLAPAASSWSPLSWLREAGARLRQRIARIMPLLA
ncbi:MAG: Hsp20/alpha crystallin family protein [Labilithrix sp.]|nr:Hsp20/alpha crystallin family protein [Labilithrix sp.]